MDATALTAPDDSGGGLGGAPGWPSDNAFRRVLNELEVAMHTSCEAQDGWPRRVAAGLDAAVDFVVSRPDAMDLLGLNGSNQRELASRYGYLIDRFSALLRRGAPLTERLPASTDEATVGGIVGLVGDHVRIGQLDRLLELKPDLVLLALLPYLGFAEARDWANSLASDL